MLYFIHVSSPTQPSHHTYTIDRPPSLSLSLSLFSGDNTGAFPSSFFLLLLFCFLFSANHTTTLQLQFFSSLVRFYFLISHQTQTLNSEKLEFTVSTVSVQTSKRDLLCAVIHVFPPRFIQKNKKTVQEFVIVNEESKPMILTLWEEFLQSEALYLTENVHKMPIILAMRLSVNTFYGISVATLPNNTIL